LLADIKTGYQCQKIAQPGYMVRTLRHLDISSIC